MPNIQDSLRTLLNTHTTYDVDAVVQLSNELISQQDKLLINPDVRDAIRNHLLLQNVSRAMRYATGKGNELAYEIEEHLVMLHAS